MMVFQESESSRIYDECEKAFQKKMTQELSKAIGKLRAGGAQLVLPDSVHKQQVAWPEDCPLSEEELRAELELVLTEAKGIQADFKALQARALKTLAKVPDLDLDDLLESIYYALTDGLQCVTDDDCVGFLDFSYAEKKLAATPESLRVEWLKRIFSPGLNSLKRPETKQRLEESGARYPTKLLGSKRTSKLLTPELVLTQVPSGTPTGFNPTAQGQLARSAASPWGRFRK